MTQQVKSIRDILSASEGPTISFEFYPPKTEKAMEQLFGEIAELEKLEPSFVSVTYGAGGSSRDNTIYILDRIMRETSLVPMSHLTCVDATKEDVLEVVQEILATGVNAVMALRGDPPGGYTDDWEPTPGGFLHASDLVSAIKTIDDSLTVSVAAFPEGHPQSKDLDESAKWFAHKLSLADFAVTQMFFDVEHYLDLVERTRGFGVDKPIIPGVMPPASGKQIHRMVSMSGCSMPTELIDSLEKYSREADQVAAGVEWASSFAQQLLEAGAPGLHLYTLNKSASSKKIVENLKL